jgi:hypothetical protein
MNERQSESSVSTGPTSAAHVIAGFRYQLLQSIATLIALGENETLHLEVSEDFSVTAPGRATDHQVKNSQAAAGPPSYSLQSKLVRECLARFWEASSVGSAERRLVFMARGGDAVERCFTFPGGQAGLLYWQAAAVDADTVPIREALSSLFAEHPLGAWLATNPGDAELRENLLRRVNWQLELVSADELAAQIKDQLRPMFRERGWPVTLADQAMRLLLERPSRSLPGPTPPTGNLTDSTCKRCSKPLDRALGSPASSPSPCPMPLPRKTFSSRSSKPSPPARFVRPRSTSCWLTCGVSPLCGSMARTVSGSPYLRDSWRTGPAVAGSSSICGRCAKTKPPHWRHGANFCA